MALWLSLHTNDPSTNLDNEVSYPSYKRQEVVGIDPDQILTDGPLPAGAKIEHRKITFPAKVTINDLITTHACLFSDDITVYERVEFKAPLCVSYGDSPYITVHIPLKEERTKPDFLDAIRDVARGS